MVMMKDNLKQKPIVRFNLEIHSDELNFHKKFVRSLDKFTEKDLQKFLCFLYLYFDKEELLED